MPDRQYHLRCGPGDVGGYVLLPGDPGRCGAIAARLDRPRPVASNREFTTWTGTLDGVATSVVSTGIGGPSASICVEELCALGVHTLVRVGTCGAIQPGIEVGEVIIAQAAVRDEGTSRQYVPGGFPAAANLDVLLALSDAARAAGGLHHVGIVQSKDSFYAEMDPRRMPVEAQLRDRHAAYVRAGVLASEMECAAVFVCAAVRGARAGAALAVVNATPAPQPMPDPERLPLGAVIEIAVDGVRRLIARDAAAGRGGAGLTRRRQT